MNHLERSKKRDISGKLSESVFFLKRFSCSNAILIFRNGKRILIDPGTTSYGNLRRLLSWLKSLNIKNIDEIWLTHAHPDHSQAIRWFPGVKVFCHPIACKILESPHPPLALLNQQKESISPLLCRFWRTSASGAHYSPKIKVINWIMLTLTRWNVNFITLNWRKIKVSGALDDGEERYGIRVMYLPGHTPDEIGFYLPEEEILITGDLLTGHELPALNVPASDIDDGIRSLKIISSLRLKFIIPAHRNIITHPKSSLEKFITATQNLKTCAQKVLIEANRKSRLGKFYQVFQVLIKWWQLYPAGCRLQKKLCLFGVLTKAILKNEPENIKLHTADTM